MKPIIGDLKNIKILSKVDDNGRETHTVTTVIELIEKDKNHKENMYDIAKMLNKPVRVDFDAVQLELGK